MITTENLNVHIKGNHILKNVNLELPEKQITCIIGPSGCGKSTLLRTLNRLIDSTEGVKIEGKVLVDGLGVGDVGSVVLRDRKHLAEDGLIVVACVVDNQTKSLMSGPDIVSRGFVYVRETEELMAEAPTVMKKTLERLLKASRDWNTIKTGMRDDLSEFIYRKTGRDPMILPIIEEV